LVFAANGASAQAGITNKVSVHMILLGHSPFYIMFGQFCNQVRPAFKKVVRKSSAR